MSNLNQIYISYAWKGDSETLADQLCEIFADKGYTIVRDKSAMSYKDSIQSFMDSIGRGRFIIAVISDKYMKSEYCMYEAYRMLQTPAFRERVFPIVLPDADIFSFKGQATYLKYWEQIFNELNTEYKNIAESSPTMAAKLTERLRDIEIATRFIGEFMAIIGDMNVLTPEMQVESDFALLIEAIENGMKEVEPGRSKNKELTRPEFQLSSDSKTRRDRITIDRFAEIMQRNCNNVFSSSLIQSKRIALKKEIRYDLTGNPLNEIIRPANDERKITDESIFEIYNKSRSMLFVFGGAGSGKTLILFELAQQLLKHYMENPANPVPIYLPLSTFKHQSLEEWIIDEIKKVRINIKIDRELLRSDKFCLLLDGLDEVPKEFQEKCEEAINEYVDTGKDYQTIVVTKRVTQTDERDGKILTFLKPDLAIKLLPLDKEQINRYIYGFGSELDGLGEAIQTDDILREEAESPLMLDILSRTYQGDDAKKLSDLKNSEEQRKTVFETYVNRMFDRNIKTRKELFPRERTERWLSWLSHKMILLNRPIFGIEHVQPELLSSNFLRQIYQIGTMAIVWVPMIFLCYWFIEAGLEVFYGVDIIGKTCIIGDTYMECPSPFYNMIVFGGPLAGIVFGLTTWYFAQRRYRYINSVYLGLAYWLFASLAFNANANLWKRPEDKDYITGIIVGFVFGLAMGFVLYLYGRQWSDKQSENQNDIQVLVVNSWDKSRAMTGLVVGLIVGVLVTIATALGVAFSNNVSNTAEFIEWYETGKRFVYTFGSSSLIGIGLVGSYIYGFLTSEPEIEKSVKPNQGIWETGKTGLVAGVLCALFIGIPFSIFAIQVNNNPQLGISFGIIFGLAVGFLFGGFAFIKHFLLRSLLWISKTFPFEAERFLEYCNGLTFLQKVGGGYKFKHDEYQSYFLSLYDLQSEG